MSDLANRALSAPQAALALALAFGPAFAACAYDFDAALEAGPIAASSGAGGSTTASGDSSATAGGAGSGASSGKRLCFEGWEAIEPWGCFRRAGETNEWHKSQEACVALGGKAAHQAVLVEDAERDAVLVKHSWPAPIWVGAKWWESRSPKGYYWNDGTLFAPDGAPGDELGWDLAAKTEGECVLLLPSRRWSTGECEPATSEPVAYHDVLCEVALCASDTECAP